MIGFFCVLLAPDNNVRLRKRRLCSFLGCLCALCVVHACVYLMHTCNMTYVRDCTQRLFFYMYMVMRSVFDCYLDV